VFETVGVETDELADADTGAAHEEEGFSEEVIVGEESFLKLSVNMGRKGSWEIGGHLGNIGCTEQEVRVAIQYIPLEEPSEVDAHVKDVFATGAGGESTVREGLNPAFGGTAVEVFNVEIGGFKPPIEISQVGEMMSATCGFEHGTQGIDEVLYTYREDV